MGDRKEPRPVPANQLKPAPPPAPPRKQPDELRLHLELEPGPAAKHAGDQFTRMAEYLRARADQHCRICSGQGWHVALNEQKTHGYLAACDCTKAVPADEPKPACTEPAAEGPFFGALVLWIDVRTGQIISGPVGTRDWAEIRRPGLSWPWVDFEGQGWIWERHLAAFRKRVPR